MDKQRKLKLPKVNFTESTILSAQKHL